MLHSPYQIQPYHFTSNIEKGFPAFFQKVAGCNGIVCFDLEDSIYTTDKADLFQLKNSHRQTLIQNLTKVAELIDLSRIGFRINRPDTSFYKDDLAAISMLKKVRCVFLPKVETHAQVEKLLHDLPPVVEEIIPIIETRKGFTFLPKILAITDPRFTKIAFGHCDFNLSNQHFPFHHHDSNVYWDWIGHLATHSELTGKQLINSPILDLDNSELFSWVLLRNKAFKSITGQVTLCLKQTVLCATPASNSGQLPFKTEKARPGIKEVAGSIMDRFLSHKMEGRFFAIDANRNLISPHEFESARMILTDTAV